MKKLGLSISILALALTGAAQATPIAKKGAKATLKVQYVFSSKGNYYSPSKDQKRDWLVRRMVDLTTVYEADTAQPFGALHQNDGAQKSMVQDLQAKSAKTQAKAQPMMADVMKIVQECHEDEACISKRVSEYGDKMPVPSDLKETSQDIKDMARPGMPRFQLWRSKSQSGTYSVGEQVDFQVFELTCTATKVCKRTTTTKGSGPIADPPGGRSTAGASMFEVDGWKGDIVIMLPVPLAPLATETTVQSSIANDPMKGGKGFAKPMMTNIKPITVSLPGDKVEASGSQSFKIDGNFEEGGLLTVNWSIKQE